jgi:hypothetical protein
MAHAGKAVFAMALAALAIAQPKHGDDNNDKGQD